MLTVADGVVASACFHCGLPVADPARWTVLIKNVLQPMCCPGCQAVASCIVAGGLENYYQYRSEFASKGDDQRKRFYTSFLAFDDVVLQKSFVQIHTAEDGTPQHETQLYVENIHCAACCWLIEHALKNKSGVYEIHVNLSSHRVLLRWDSQKYKLSELLQFIYELGYSAQPYQAAAVKDSISKENKRQLLRLGIAGIGMMQAMMFALALYSGDFTGINNDHKHFMQVFSLLVTLPVLFYSATPFFNNAWRNICNFHVGMDVPVSLALLIAFAASLYAVIFQIGNVYFDSISMFVFLLLLARYAETAVRQRFLDLSSVSTLALTCQCLPDPLQPSQLETVPVNSITAGQLICVKAGECIPLDGVIVAGNSSVNEAAFSGEQAPLPKLAGDTVLAGTINGDGVLTIRVTNAAGYTRLDLISRLSDWSLTQKPRVTVMADQLASVFTIMVLVLAGGAGYYWYDQGNPQTLAIVLSILVVSCPCALSLATPSALACAYQALRKNGLLVNSSNMIEQMHKISRVIFDKTGTLTQGNFSVSKVQMLASEPFYTVTLVKELSAALERYSEHPIAAAFRPIATDINMVDVKVSSAKGIEGFWKGECYRIGSREFCESLAGEVQVTGMGFDNDSHVYLVKSNQWLAAFSLHDELRPEAQQLVDQLQASGKQVEILSGDSSGAAESLAMQLGISVCHSRMRPEQKLDYISQLQRQGCHVMMVGDGINDIPVLAKANVSVAMSNASDLAKIKADAMLLSSNLLPVLDLFKHCAKTRRVILQNIGWALLYNGLALPAAAMGLVAPWQAAVGMSVSSLWVTFNSLRLRAL